MPWLWLAVGVEDQNLGLVDGSLPEPLPQASEGGAPRGALSRRTHTPTLLRPGGRGPGLAQGWGAMAAWEALDGPSARCQCPLTPRTFMPAYRGGIYVGLPDAD